MNIFLEDILAQPGALDLTLTTMLGEARPAMERAAGRIAQAERVVLTSMGSAYYSLTPMAYALSRLHPNIHLQETAELMRQPFMPGTLYVVMSRSGESREIVQFSTRIRERGHPLIAITMTPSSTLAVNATLVIHDPAPFDGFICTKAYTSLALTGLLIVSTLEHELNDQLTTSLRAAFHWMEANQSTMLDKVRRVACLGQPLTFLSRGAGMGLAQSGALWLEEAARLRASASTIDFYLHGPVEQVDEQFNGMWIDLLPDELSRAQFRSMLSTGGSWILVGPEAPETSGPSGIYGFNVPGFDLPEPYRILPSALPVQLVAYQSATCLGLEAGEMRYLHWVVK